MTTQIDRWTLINGLATAEEKYLELAQKAEDNTFLETRSLAKVFRELAAEMHTLADTLEQADGPIELTDWTPTVIDRLGA